MVTKVPRSLLGFVLSFVRASLHLCKGLTFPRSMDYNGLDPTIRTQLQTKEKEKRVRRQPKARQKPLKGEIVRPPRSPLVDADIVSLQHLRIIQQIICLQIAISMSLTAIRPHCQRFFIPRYTASGLTRWYSMLGKSSPSYK